VGAKTTPTTQASSGPSRSGRQRSRSTDISPQLLEAALSILTDEGVDGITVRNVAAHAGVAPAGVYSRFDGKSGLLDALLSQGFEGLHQAIVAASGPDARARLISACTAYRRFALDHPEHYRLMFDHKQVVSMSPESAERAEVAFGELVSRVHDGQDAGLLAPGKPVEVAQQIWSALHGAVSLELNGIGFSQDPQVSYDDLVTTVLRGLTGEAPSGIGLIGRGGRPRR